MLDEQKVGYTHHTHAPAYTAQEVAGAEHVPGREFAKTVMLTDGDEFVMAVLPATRKIDLPSFKKIVGNNKLRLATEDEFKGLFPRSRSTRARIRTRFRSRTPTTSDSSSQIRRNSRNPSETASGRENLDTAGRLRIFAQVLTPGAICVGSSRRITTIDLS
jgi:hypothetical protein